jgi:hypothetical protein
MSERQVYHVKPHGDGWQVELEGAGHASNSYSTKKEAIERGRELAKSPPFGQLIVHKADGTIQTEYTYGADPPKYPG